MLYKKIEYGIDNLTNEQFLEIQDSFIYKDYLEIEKKYLEEYNIKVTEININSSYIIVEDNIKLHSNMYKNLEILSIKDCNPQGKLFNKIDERKNTILSSINKSKIDFIKEYFLKNKITIGNIKPYICRAGLIEFDCFVCKKSNSKCYMMVDTFIIRTQSKTDCVDEKHQRGFKTLTNKLRKLWEKRKRKEIGEYTLNIEEVKSTIKESFPLIVKHSISNELYYYDEEKKHYVELQEKKNRNDLNTLIRNSFYIESFNELYGITIKQLNDIKSLIREQLLLNYKEANPQNYINLKNGIYDIKNKILLPHSSDFFFTHKLPVEYKEDINTKWLDELFGNWGLDLDIIKKYLGYTFQPSNELELFFIFKTESGAGKGTFLKMQQCIFGDKMINISLENLYSEFISLPPGQKIENATLIYDADISGNFFVKHDPKRIIKLSSGEGMTINGKYKESYYISKNICKLMLSSNDTFKLNSSFDNGGFDRRHYEIVFKKNWSKKQTKLFQNFIDDDDKKSQYLSYILQGLEMFNNMSDEIDFFPIDKAKVLERKKESEPIIEFLDDNFQKTETFSDSVQFSIIMNAYEKFININKYKFSVSSGTMKNKIHEFFGIDKKFINYAISVKGNKFKGVRYLKLKPDIPAETNKDNIIPFKNENPL